MDILKLTDSDSILTVLGITSADVDDKYFDQSDMEVEVELHFESWLPNYTDIISEGTTNTPSVAQKTAHKHMGIYVKYFCADMVSKSSNFMLSQMESDGENEFQRFQDNRLEKLVDSIHRKMSTHRAYLANYSVTTFNTTEEITTYSQFGKATPDTDPVTGETT